MKKNLKHHEAVRHLINLAVKDIEGVFMSYQKNMNESAFARHQAILSCEEDGGLDAIVLPELSIIRMEGAVEAMREAVNSGSLAEEISRRLRFRKRAIATVTETDTERVIEFTRLGRVYLDEDWKTKTVLVEVKVSDGLRHPRL